LQPLYQGGYIARAEAGVRKVVGGHNDLFVLLPRRRICGKGSFAPYLPLR